MKNNYDPEVIVVDDDKEAAEAFSDLLNSKLNIGVIAETEPDKVLALIHQYKIKVVVLDQRMPSISGTELYKKIHKENPYIKAVMLTGEAERNEVAEAMDELGYAGFLEKNELERLHIKVLVAYAKYEKDLSIVKEMSPLTKINCLNPLRNRLFTIRYDILSIDKTRDNVILSNKWQTKFTLEAAEQNFEESFDFEDEIILSSEDKLSFSHNYAGLLPILPSFKSEIDAAISHAYNMSKRHRRSHSKKVTTRYKLQDNVEQGKVAIKKVFEVAPVYSEFRVLIRKKCRICGSTQIRSFLVQKRQQRDVTRTIIYYTDGTCNEINTGYISL